MKSRFSNSKRSRIPLLMTFLLFGYAFLYGPILSLIVYSFNESRLVTVWGGWSTKWYAELLQNQVQIELEVLKTNIR